MNSAFLDRVYDTIFWTSLAVVLIWYILKSTGVIQTPLWLELLPYAGFIFGAGAFFQRVGGDIRMLKSDMQSVRTELHLLDVRTHLIEKDVAIIKSR